MSHPTKRGSAALEYVIVSIFAGALALAAISFIGTFVTNKVTWLKEKFGLEEDINLLPDLSD